MGKAASEPTTLKGSILEKYIRDNGIDIPALCATVPMSPAHLYDLFKTDLVGNSKKLRTLCLRLGIDLSSLRTKGVIVKLKSPPDSPLVEFAKTITDPEQQAFLLKVMQKLSK